MAVDLDKWFDAVRDHPITKLLEERDEVAKARSGDQAAAQEAPRSTTRRVTRLRYTIKRLSVAELDRHIADCLARKQELAALMRGDHSGHPAQAGSDGDVQE